MGLYQLWSVRSERAGVHYCLIFKGVKDWQLGLKGTWLVWHQMTMMDKQIYSPYGTLLAEYQISGWAWISIQYADHADTLHPYQSVNIFNDIQSNLSEILCASTTSRRSQRLLLIQLTQYELYLRLANAPKSSQILRYCPAWARSSRFHDDRTLCYRMTVAPLGWVCWHVVAASRQADHPLYSKLMDSMSGSPAPLTVRDDTARLITSSIDLITQPDFHKC